jgi:CRP/FNR family transcriptional regulator, cyclic AMP receptor protein
MNQFKLVDISQVQKLQLLETFEWAHDLSAIQLDKLAGYLKFYSAPKSMTILKEGESNDFFCFLCEGQVDIIKANMAEQNKNLKTLSAGKVFGEMSFFDRGTCSASVIVKEDIKMLVMDKKSFDTLSFESPNIALQIAMNLIRDISQRLRQTTGQLVDSL